MAPGYHQHSLTVDEARAFFAHPSQQRMGLAPEFLPSEGFEYRASGPVCLVFHLAPWPDVWMAHLGVKTEAWGRTVQHCSALLAGFWAEKQPIRIIAWIEERNRAAISLARRCGMTQDGQFPGVVMMGWSKCQSEQ